MNLTYTKPQERRVPAASIFPGLLCRDVDRSGFTLMRVRLPDELCSRANVSASGVFFARLVDGKVILLDPTTEVIAVTGEALLKDLP